VKLPTLYKKTSAGADQRWDIWTEENVIVTQWGQVDGKIQETRDLVKEGKNAGRSNATTPEQQAESEAQSRWEKKLKKGYVKSLEAADAGEVDELIQGGIFPMLAQRFDQQGHKLSYPCYVQPKLDGHRCIAMVDTDGACTLWTRSRKPITSMNHIAAAIESLGFRSTIFDGELYNHAYKNDFEKLTSFIRDDEAKPGSTDVQYHIYDIVFDGPFSDRTAVLSDITPDRDGHLVFVDTKLVEDEDEMMLHFQRYLKEGYEGLMARNADGPYVENKRSYDLFKIKEFVDSEFEVVGVEEGRGKLAGHGIFVCRTVDGTEFSVKMMGATEELRKYYEDPSLAVGRWLTVKYQGMTKKKGVPRFPVAVRFREDI
jgi:ATP-dependent DNA ligase